MTKSCLLCLSAAPGKSYFCSACLGDLPRRPPSLCRCALHPTSAPGDLCGQCLASPPAYSNIISAYAYSYPVDQLLTRYKYQRQLAVESALVQLWLANPPDAQVDALVPMPLHWRRFIRRGFNQAARLAKPLSRHTGLPLVPLLTRHHHLHSQQGLSAVARRQNLRHAFRLKGQAAGLRLAVIDDVVTTGATAEAASACLLAGGAREVQVWSLFRTL